MSRRIFARSASKVQVGVILAAAVVGAASFAPAARAENVYVADTINVLTDANAFVGGVLPAPGLDTVVFGEALNGTVNSSKTWSVGAASTDNSWRGITVVSPDGDITIADATNTLGLSGGGIDMASATVNLTLNVGLGIGAGQTWSVAEGRTLTIGGTVTGGFPLVMAGGGTTVITGSLQGDAMTVSKVGTGTLTLTSQNTYKGATTVGDGTQSGGTVILDFSGAGAPDSKIISSSSALRVSNAFVHFVGNADVAVAQTFNGMTATVGLTTLSATSLGMGIRVNLGTLARNYNQGASVRIIPSSQATLSYFQATNAAAGGPSGLVEINNISSTSNNAGPYMTWGLDDYAGVSLGQIGAIAYTSKADGSSILATANGTIYDILNGTSGTVTCSSYNVEGVRFAGAGTKTFNATGTAVLGGVLVSPSVGTDTVTIGATGSGGLRVQNNSDLVIWQNNTQANVILSAPLAPRVGGSYLGSLVKNGAGILVLTTTSNSLNGRMFVNEGLMQINAASALSTSGGTEIVLQGGGLSVNGTFANANGTAQHPLRIAGDGGVLQVTAANVFTIASSTTAAITGSALLTKIGPGTLALANTASTWSGGLAISDGLVDVQGATGTPLGSGPVKVNGGTLGFSGTFNGVNALSVNSGGTITATGNLMSAFTVRGGGTYLVNTGTVGGAITLTSGAIVTGTGGTAAPVMLPSEAIIEPAGRLGVGTLSFQSLALEAGSILNMTLQSDGDTGDVINLMSGGTLNLGSNVVLNMYDTTSGSPCFHNGSHSLFSGIDVLAAGKYMGGSATEGVLTNFVAGNFNPQHINGASATFSMVGPATASSIIVTIAGIAMASTWAGTGGGAWNDAGSWTAGIPGSAAGDQASFVGSVVPGVIDLGTAPQHLGALAMDAGTQGCSWTIISTGGGKLLLDNGANAAAIQVGCGAGNGIGADMDLLSPTTVELTGSASALTVSGIIHTPGTASTFTLQGAVPARLIVTADNTITSPIHIAGATLQVGNGGITGSLGTGAVRNEASLVFDRADILVVPNAISGSGTLTHIGPGTTTLSGAANYGGPTILSAGRLDFAGGVSHTIAGVSGTGSLSVAASTVLTSDGVNLPAGSLIVAGTQAIRSSAAAAYAAYATGSGATVLSGTSKVSVLNTTGSLDIKNNALIIQTANTTSKAALLAAIANTASGMLVTGAITSSSAASNVNYTLSVLDNGLLGASTFGGLPVTPTSVIVTETLKGDATMDGSVDLLDLARWKANAGHTNVYSPVGGDMNGDGGVDLLDLAMWKANAGHNITTSPAPSDFSSGGLGTLSAPALSGGTTAVPEPASLAVLAIGAVGLLTWRRKNTWLATRRR